jgi:ribonuclease-3
MSADKIPELARKLNFPEEALPILREALTHRTYAVEHAIKYDNQRLEFLGDAVLEMITTEELYKRYPDMPEGDMTKIRSAFSCETTLSDFARKLELGKYLLVGKGEKESGGNRRNSTLADLFEAVLGAIYLGCGIVAAKKFLLNELGSAYPDPKVCLTSLNPKGRLQEYSQKKWGCTPEYRLFRHGGPQHMPFYEVEVRLTKYVSVGRGSSRKNAEIAAAAMLCSYFDAREKQAK